MKSVVVTGASTGIGWGCVKVLTGKGFHVFGSVRKQADAERLQKEFGASFTPLIFVIANPGPLLHLDIAAFRQQMEVNVTGQLIVTQAFAPLLGATPDAKSKERGRICMMSSVGGKVASPFLGPYSASKFALEGLSESLRRELLIYGVDVIIIAPGAIATPIWDKADALDVSRYANTPYKTSLDLVKKYMVGLGQKGLPPERIGETVHTALTTPNPKTRYIVTPEPLTNWLGNNLPKRMLDNTIAKRLGLTRQF